MKTRRIGDSGLVVSEIALGSWLTMEGSGDETAATRLVEHAIDLGINLFDTADVYDNGEAERLLGRALQRVPRHRVVIATKCFFPISGAANDGGLSRKHVFESVEASLRRLGMDYLDLHQCHRFDAETPTDETVRAYEDLIRQGKLLYWGVSEWGASEIAEACDRADARNAYRPISNQPQYSIVRRQLEGDVLAECRRLGLGQLVFSPLGQGVLTGKYTGGALPTGSRATDDRHNRWMDAYLDDALLERIDRLEPIAQSLSCTMAQLALAWCLRRSEIASVIIGATRIEQLEENCAASGLTLPDDAVAEIDRLFPGPGAAAP